MRTTAAAAFLALVALAAQVSEGKPVVGFYSEGLCPYCRRYLRNVLLPLQAKGLLEHVDFKMYASGNAHRKLNHTTGERYMKCQHGPDECALNILLGCTMEHSAEEHWLGSVACLEGFGKRALTMPAARRLCMPPKVLEKVNECSNGDEGQQIFEAAYNATRDLKVRHRWVPWVVVDDVPLYEAASSLPTAICLNIPKDKRPEMCYTNLYEAGEDEQSNGIGIPVDDALVKITDDFTVEVSDEDFTEMTSDDSTDIFIAQ